MLKTVIFWLEFTLCYYKIIVDQTWKTFNTKFGPQWKDRENSYQVRQILAVFCILVALILVWNCVKGLRVTKIVKQIKFEGVWGKLEARSCLQRQPFTKYSRQTIVFMWNSELREKVQFLFFSSFLLILTKFSFWEEEWALGYNSMKF